jgi:hypothetical protein
MLVSVSADDNEPGILAGSREKGLRLTANSGRKREHCAEEQKGVKRLNEEAGSGPGRMAIGEDLPGMGITLGNPCPGALVQPTIFS